MDLAKKLTAFKMNKMVKNSEAPIINHKEKRKRAKTFKIKSSSLSDMPSRQTNGDDVRASNIDPAMAQQLGLMLNGNNKKRASFSQPETGNHDLASSVKRRKRVASSGLENPNLSPEINFIKLPDCGVKCLEWLIHPITPKQLFSDIFEKKPFLIRRHNPNYYKGVFSCNEMDQILRRENVEFGKHLDVTSYSDGERKTLTPVGRAYSALVWDYFQNGCSIRMLSPQTHSPGIWKINSMLQDYFQNFVGANVYLTPKGTQGFAPHYDDIEAFVLQLEGKKMWNVYAPRNPSEELPRFSSPNFKQEEIGEPILTVELCPGDLLYFPRGFIHQCKASEDIHSLHITISTCQKNTWGDFLEKLIPQALNNAMRDDLDFRRSLPVGYLNYMGVAHNDQECGERDAFLMKIRNLFGKLIEHLPIDAAADQMGKKFLNQALPPKLTKEEKQCSIHGNGENWHNGGILQRETLALNSSVRLLNPQTIRLVMEEEEVRVYHSMENTKVYEEADEQYMVVGFELAPGVEALLHTYPEYINVEDLPLSHEKEKLELVSLLYDKGLLLTEQPLQIIDSK